MDLIICFSGRPNGNCDQIAKFISSSDSNIVYFRDLNVHPCFGCQYECFAGACKYRNDGLYGLYESMTQYDRVILLVPMYCGNPASLYFAFNERSQDYFMHNDTYDEIIKRLYIIGIYGNAKATPDYIPSLEKWFSDTPYHNRVLGIERHLYDQRIKDQILDVEEVKTKITNFLK